MSERKFKNILVTGGCGFIGNVFIRHVLKHHGDVRIINLDSLTYCGNLANTEDFRNDRRYTFVHGDIRNKELIRHLLKAEKIDAIVNFAAESHVDKSIDNPLTTFDTNIGGTIALISEAHKAKVSRFLQVSTDEVYGSLGVNDPSFDEKSPIEPNTPYSASKAAADCIVMAWSGTYQMDTVITRCSNNYGPYQFPEKFIPRCISRLMNGQKIQLHGTGRHIRDWIHVEDHCAGVWMALTRGTRGEVYNLGSDGERTTSEIAAIILNYFGHGPEMVEYIDDRPNNDLRYSMDSRKARCFLGWLPFYGGKSTDEGIRKSIQWYVDNKTWMDNILNSQYLKDNVMLCSEKGEK